MNFSQMDQNTVQAEKQLKGPCRLLREGTGRRILFVGNSITLHGVNESIGWHGEWGMAASCREKDYVHRVMAHLTEKEDAAFAICQISAWEKNYQNGESLFSSYAAARDFAPDVIVFRAMENCPKADFNKEVFLKEAKKLLSYLDPKGRAALCFTTPFWHHPGDEAMEVLAKEFGAPLILLGDLGERDEMKALGKFEHRGVSVHPSDRGMEEIAARLCRVLSKEERNA